MPPGLEVSVSADPDTATAGGTVTFTVHVRDTDGAWLGALISFGDGTEDGFSDSPFCGQQPQPTDETRSFQHAYQDGGRHQVTVTVRTGGGCPDGAPEEQGSDSTSVFVIGL